MPLSPTMYSPDGSICWRSIFSFSCIDHAISRYCMQWKNGTTRRTIPSRAPSTNQMNCAAAGTRMIGGSSRFWLDRPANGQHQEEATANPRDILE